MNKEYISIADLLESIRRERGYDILVDKVIPRAGTVDIYIKENRKPVTITKEVFKKIKDYIKTGGQ